MPTVLLKQTFEEELAELDLRNLDPAPERVKDVPMIEHDPEVDRVKARASLAEIGKGLGFSK